MNFSLDNFPSENMPNDFSRNEYFSTIGDKITLDLFDSLFGGLRPNV
jgi:hypothetical protein